MSIKCICVDDTKRPKEIPVSKWPVKGNEYHVTHVFRCLSEIQLGVQGVELAEFDISDCQPYGYYRLSRFSFTLEDLFAMFKMADDCKQLDDADIMKQVQELVEHDHLVLHEQD